MTKGRTYELDTVRGIHEATDSDFVWATAIDYSGGAADSNADIAIVYPEGREATELQLVELKKRQGDDGNRVVVMGGSGTDETGRDELRRLVDAGPRMATSWLAIKFDHRELVCVPAAWVWERVVDAELSEDYRHTNEIPSDAAQRYVRRTRTPSYWTPSDELKRLAPRLTDADSLSMVKPSLDWWESSSAGRDDVSVLLNTMDVPERYYETT